MRPGAVAEGLPRGFRVLESDRGVLAVREDLADGLLAAGFGPDGGERLATSTLSGRSPLLELTLGARRLVVRRFRHGGLLRALTGARFADPRRPFRELALAATLAERGVSTAACVAARARRSHGPFWSLDLVTERVEDVLDGGELLARLAAGDLPAAARRQTVEALGGLVGALHRAGCLHADLQPKNLLLNRGALDGEPARAWILDLDRSELCASLADRERHANLARLARAVGRRHGRALRRGDLARFLCAYARSRGASAEDWRADWRGIARQQASGLLWHRLGWRLEALFAPRRSELRS